MAKAPFNPFAAMRAIEEAVEKHSLLRRLLCRLRAMAMRHRVGPDYYLFFNNFLPRNAHS